MSVRADVSAHIPTRLTLVASGTLVVTPVLLVDSENIRPGRERPADIDADASGIPGSVPHQCVFVQDTSGLNDRVFHGQDVAVVAPQDWDRVENTSVQILIRGNPNDYDITAEIAEACRLAIDKSPPPGYCWARVVGGRSLWLTTDDRDRDLFAINVDLRRDFFV